MLIAVPLFAVYILALGFRLFQAARRQRLQDQPGYTRHLDPRMGLFGLFGFLGFLGFWTYAAQRVIFPFFFFIFFGFFGFYYEGKLSDTLADEMFEEHRLKAQLKAYKIGMSLIFLMLWLVGFGLFSQQLDYVAIYLTIGISLAYAVTVFMSEYLLYVLGLFCLPCLILALFCLLCFSLFCLLSWGQQIFSGDYSYTCEVFLFLCF